ncbi:MAG: hypothetical protein A2648_00085 [Candidatus Lloydbacteria bacterium RIFCSPHIGHO2_01_FULL_41_20]|uniref:Serine protease n=1 Tax=Candidatus Lloydbacteria bacterium RIFCSPHIGHO2_01_FULL_41_20 TaxID=1798657 RepID=A0A1G2CU63_9BACT|nr:MAG: hypothetical protein A2648_00085 [Candidatus Lloydbacteria bacterium RIFCSPHIGHO2_01_FULL_41_20]
MASFIAGLKTKILIPIIIAISGFFGVAHTEPKIATPQPVLVKKIEVVEIKTQIATSTTPKTATTTKKSLLIKKVPVSIIEEVDPILARKLEILKKIERGELLSQTEENEKLRGNIINIFCTTKTSGDFEPLSGSGVVINDKGIILTNAHMGQYFLLKNYRMKDFMSCIGRIGSPAMPFYMLELLYLPESWLKENASKIKEQEPTGTGENDYAFLGITGVIPRGTAIPVSFAHSVPETEDIFIIGTPILLAAYPAGFLDGIILQQSLWLASSASNIEKNYYFSTPSTTDLFSIKGNILSQKGASGGAVTSLVTGNLLGVITTATDAKTTAERELNALTLPYIEKAFEKESGKKWADFLETNVATLANNFNETMRDKLTTLITEVLDK